MNLAHGDSKGKENVRVQKFYNLNMPQPLKSLICVSHKMFEVS